MGTTPVGIDQHSDKTSAPSHPADAAPALEQSDLLGMISHELRSPLAAIQGYAATLRRHEQRLSTSERHEYLRAIEDASARLDIIIGRMLLLSQLENGSIVPLITTVDMARLLREALTTAAARVMRATPSEAPEFRLIIGYGRVGASELEAGKAEEFLADGDPRLLRVVLDQLIDNALKFTPPGGLIVLAVHHAPASADGQTGSYPPPIEVTVKNTGSAIPPEHLERIFDRFHQAHSGLTRTSGGLGLGLAICQHIVALHGGSLTVASDTSMSTFTLRLASAHVA